MHFLHSLFAVSYRNIMRQYSFSSVCYHSSGNEILVGMNNIKRTIPIKMHGPAAAALDVRRRKALQRSWQRGMKEVDLLLGSYANENLGKMSDEKLFKYEVVLDVIDNDLILYLTGKREYPSHLDTGLMEELKQHTRDYAKTQLQK